LSNTRSSTTEGGYLIVPKDGGRSNLLVRIGGYFAGEGLNPDLINAIYHEINTNEHSPFDVAISDAEVDKISTSFKDGPDDPVTLSGADAKKVTGGWISWLKGRGLEPELVNDLMLLIRDHDEPLMQNLDYRRSGSVTKPLASMATGRRRPCMKTYSKTCLTDRATPAICWKQN
jgi:hypothetical protein